MMTHMRTSPRPPKLGGKREVYHESLKSDYVRPCSDLTAKIATCLMQYGVDYNSTAPLHSAIGFVETPGMVASRD